MEILYALLTLVVTGAFLAIFWVLPIVLGLVWAKRNKISPHWMWFGIHPVGGWLASLCDYNDETTPTNNLE